MLPVISASLAFVVGLFRSRASLCLEHLALRHQLAVYQQTIARPRLRSTDRVLWTCLSRLWPGWREAVAFVQPHTVIAWQRQRFRDHWRRLSQRGKPGRPAIPTEVRQLSRDLWRANPTWSLPRIVGELRQLGIDVAKAMVETYQVRPHKPPSPMWKAFLTNHVRGLTALDCLIVPTVTHTVLFVRLILTHERRRVVPCNVTEHPTAVWTAQQVVDAFPWDKAPRDLLRDRNQSYGTSFRQRVQHIDFEEVLMAPRTPCQNPYVERLIGSSRCACLDHVIILHGRHLRRLLTGSCQYDHHWRTPRTLEMDCPLPRPVQRSEVDPIREVPEVGGWHHHYERQAA
jgi:hypothetical protein